jgi:prevent-host-death family protein
VCAKSRRESASLTNLTKAPRATKGTGMPRTVNLYEAKTRFLALVDAAERGEEIIIAKNGVAKARLAPIGPPKRVRKPSGLLAISYISDDFNAPDRELVGLYEAEA